MKTNKLIALILILLFTASPVAFALDVVTSSNPGYSAWGENIASGQDTPELVVYEWMNSPTHRAYTFTLFYFYWCRILC